MHTEYSKWMFIVKTEVVRHINFRLTGYRRDALYPCFANVIMLKDKSRKLRLSPLDKLTNRLIIHQFSYLPN